MKLLAENAIAFDKEVLEQFERLQNALTYNFVELTEICGLNPAVDFKNANLRGVDFSNCDLSGFDFFGADLEESYGINVTIGKNTNLGSANTSNSMFEEEQKARKELEHDPVLDAKITQLRGKHWTTAASWFLDHLSLEAQNENRLSAIILRIFEFVPELRATALDVAKKRMKSRGKYLRFLALIASKPDLPVSSILVISRQVASQFDKDITYYNYFLNLMSHPDNAVRAIAINVFLQTSMPQNLADKFVAEIAQEQFPANRQFYIRTKLEGLRHSLGLPFHIVFRDLKVFDDYRDWIVPFTIAELKTITQTYRRVFASPALAESACTRFESMFSSERLRDLTRKGGSLKDHEQLSLLVRMLAIAVGRGIPYVLVR